MLIQHELQRTVQPEIPFREHAQIAALARMVIVVGR
jgi:hypothetical protein